MMTKDTPAPPADYAAAVEEITRIYRSLPPTRPSIEEVEAANSVLRTVEAEQNLELEEISAMQPAQDVPAELFSVLQDVKRAVVGLKSHEQRKEAAQLVELDRNFQVFDELIQKASSLVSGEKAVDPGAIKDVSVTGEVDKPVAFAKLEDLKSADRVNGFPSSKIIASSSGEIESDKLDLFQVAAVIESSFKTKARTLDLRGKLLDKVEWLPLSLGKLSSLTELYLSQNRLMALPNPIATLHTLTKLDVRGNQLFNLPSSFGQLENLIDLDLSANLLKSLPESFKDLVKMVNLDISSNRFSSLPDSVGSLVSLRRLNVDTNDLEELPYSIGSCSCLVELILDFNRLKVLPESIGNLRRLEILSLHYNRVKRLPSTVGSLSSLRELDVSFNELESVPETLCLDVSLKKLDLGRNFADLRRLPQSIGNLEMLEELDVSDNQIKILPDSFRFLWRLRSFSADRAPLDVPPHHVTKLGAQAVVQYMADYVVGRDLDRQMTKKKRGLCFYICPLLCFNIGDQ